MKIFLVSNMFPSEKDHLFGVFVKNFKTELEKQGVLFSRTSLIKGKSYSKIKKIFRYLKHYAQVCRNFFSNDFDLFYIHYLTHHIPVLFLLLPFKKKPWVVNVHGSDINSLAHNKYLKFWGRIILKHIDLLVVPTTDFLKMVQLFFPFMDANKIAVSPSGGVDESIFYPLNHPNDDILVLGFVSRLTEEKGWKEFLDALLILKKEGFVFKAIIGGKGPDEQHIKSFIARNELEKEVTFLGFIPQEILYKTYNKLHLYVFPTYRDSLGLTGLEAMSCGIPVVASKIEGGPTTYVEHGVNGFLFTPKDSLALSSAIKQYVRMDIIQKQKLTQNALKTARNYQRSTVATALIEHLQYLLPTQQS